MRDTSRVLIRLKAILGGGGRRNPSPGLVLPRGLEGLAEQGWFQLGVLTKSSPCKLMAKFGCFKLWEFAKKKSEFYLIFKLQDCTELLNMGSLPQLSVHSPLFTPLS